MSGKIRKGIILFFVAMMMLVGAQSAFAAVETEPNNDGPSADAADFGSPNGGITSTDSDYWTFVSPKSGSSNLFVINQSTSSTLDVYLYDSNGNFLVIDNISASSSANYSINLQQGMRYYVVLASSGTAGYNFVVS